MLAGEWSHRLVYALRAVENGPSNGVCAMLDFEMLGIESLEYPPGSDTWMKCAVWRHELPVD